MRIDELRAWLPSPAAVGRELGLQVPFALYLLLAVLVGSWIVDDAGISYAYARSFASGHGLAAQPGLPPVEGFSNFLWVILLGPFVLLRIFHPVVLPKALSALLVLLTFLLLRRSLRREAESDGPAWFAAAALALAPPIVIWTMSGLENALTLFLAAAYAVQLVDRQPRWEIKAGVLAALLAATHPELILLFATGLVVCAREGRAGRRSLLTFVAAFAAPMAAFIALRLALFGLPLPHTWYAKRTSATLLERLTALLSSPGVTWRRILALARGLAGHLGVALLLLSLAGAGLLALRRRLSRAVFVWVALALNAIIAFLWMEDDWMGELRFATVVVLATFVTVALVGDVLLRAWAVTRPTRAALAACALVLLLADGAPRVVRFAANPTTPYADVSRRTAAQFDAYAAILARPGASILVADVGATLYESRLRVYDLAGLCEPDLIRAIKGGTPVWRIGHADFYDYVFDRTRPTFISTDKFWTHVTAFERDPRFRRDYVAINAYLDRYVQGTYRLELRSGDFVRRDALRSPGDVERMRQAYRPAPRPDPLVHRLADWWSAAAGPDEARQRATDLLARGNDPNRAASLLARAIGREGARADDLALVARALDAAGRPHDARVFWTRVAAAESPGAGPLGTEAFDRLGDSRPAGTGGDALDPDLQAAVRLLYTDRAPARALAALDEVLAANPSHYGARFQRARALSLLGRKREAQTAWRLVLALASRISDRATMATARAELGTVVGDAR
jgi:tetratricopeptide (TPR) repeat protein